MAALKTTEGMISERYRLVEFEPSSNKYQPVPVHPSYYAVLPFTETA